MLILRRHLDGGSAAKRIGIALAALLFFLLLSEALMTLFDAKQVRNDIEYYIARTFTREEWKIATQMRDILLDLDRRPFCVKDTILYLYRPMHTKYLNINSDGFRGPEITPKQPGEYRIIITGASISYGLYFPDQQTMPAVVEKRLREQCPECRITVYNLGIEGYDLKRDIALVDRLVDKIAPDLVLFYAGGADVNYVYTWGYRTHEPFNHDGPFNEEQLRALQPLYKKTWLDYSRVVRLVANSVKSEKGFLPEPMRLAEAFTPGVPPDLEQKAKEFGEGFVNDMATVSARLGARGIETLFAFMPDSVFKEPRSPLESSTLKIFDSMYPHFGAFAMSCREHVREEVRETKFDKFYDFSDSFDGIEADIFYDFIHMTPRGNRELGDKMGDLLIEKGVLEKARKAAATPNPSR